MLEELIVSSKKNKTVNMWLKYVAKISLFG